MVDYPRVASEQGGGGVVILSHLNFNDPNDTQNVVKLPRRTRSTHTNIRSSAVLEVFIHKNHQRNPSPRKSHLVSDRNITRDHSPSQGAGGGGAGNYDCVDISGRQKHALCVGELFPCPTMVPFNFSSRYQSQETVQSRK